MKKRLLCILLAVALLLSLCPAVLAAEPQAGLDNFRKVDTYQEGQFRDIKSTNWYAANVKTSFELGLINGKGDGTFDPDGEIKVVEAIVLAARIHSIYHTGKADFVQGKPWYQGYVDYAVTNGIIRAGEYSDFNAVATRAQYAKIFAAALPASELKAINDIAVGSVRDLPANTDYAEAVYLLYNAGIITGNDDYGTFAANTGIKRSEAATLATRMVDPDLRKEFEPKVYDPYPPTMATIQDIQVSRSATSTDLHIGQSTQLDVILTPEKAHSGITWTSSDPAVASVSEYGKVTAHKNGTAVITATTYNGINDTFKINVPYEAAQLQYALTADGKGYEIVGCDVNAYTIHIPAVYNSLPVVSIRGGTFKDCQNLRFFTVGENQTTFYEDGGVVFTDIPEKTLVVFPPAYDKADYYYVPDDTVAVADYAFAGLKTLVTLTMQEGLRRLGDYALSQLKSSWGYHNLMLYMPDSLTEIGAHILQGQTRNAAIYCHWGTKIAEYAQKEQIPVAGVFDLEQDQSTVLTQVPECVDFAKMIPTKESGVLSVDAFWSLPSNVYEMGAISQFYDLSCYQAEHSGEVRLILDAVWSAILPDVNGETAAEFSEQTGLYGAGCTDGETVLRGYDLYGNLVAMQYVSGDFAFSFPGAYSLGVEGGVNTSLTVLPVEPVFISSSGIYPIQPKSGHYYEDGRFIQYFVIQIPYSSFYFDVPDYLNLFTYSLKDSATGEEPENSPHYVVLQFNTTDASRVDAMKNVSIVFDGMELLLDTEDFICLVASQFGRTEKFAKNLYSLLTEVKRTMVGTYFPTAQTVHKITIFGDGSYPAADWNGVITLDESAILQEDKFTFAHEMVHAVDGSIDAVEMVPPGTWMEGRAEYIGFLICKEYGYEYYNSHLHFDWSYLSEEDKADFFHYYYFATNRETEYPVGYHFLCYLNETYGEDISSKIMANIAALTEWDFVQRSEANAALFKQCVEAATEVGVFQNFVRDVIEKQ